ncbi:hypothetical protein [Schaalia hyovaginalis]|uniref:Uncharacterized protein n=1 Tax=Schaalia hyovaginalis TaxID=29316 RepID=A0A923E612_9ACTO|nr:hypothetical protein [Schaalia hyovaginalis]MBB6335508.1 hypothetical protein [Schaalia hyovaginalis]
MEEAEPLADENGTITRYQSWITRNLADLSQVLDNRVLAVEDAVTARETAKIKARAGNPQKAVSAPELEAALERSTTLKKAAGLARGASEFATFAGAAFVAWDVATTEESPSARLAGGIGGIGSGAVSGTLSVPLAAAIPGLPIAIGVAAGVAGDAATRTTYEYATPLEWRDWFDEGIRDARECVGFAW